MKKSKILALIAVLCIVFSNFNFLVAKDTEMYSDFTDGFSWIQNTDGEKTCTILSYNGKIYTNIIPDELEGYTVTRIGNGAFEENQQIIGEVRIPDGVISVGNEAFSKCFNIKHIRFGANLIDIGDGAFFRCNMLEKVTFNNKIQNIGRIAFNDCIGLHSFNMVIPDSVKYIGDSAFANTGISTIKFNSIQAPRIEPNTFSDCDELKIQVPRLGVGYTPQNYWPETVIYSLLGDMNKDDKVNATDAAMVLDRYKYKNATDQDMKIGDMNNDGKLNATDAAMILDIYKNNK